MSGQTTEVRRGSVLSNIEPHPSGATMAGSPDGQASSSTRRSPSDDSLGGPASMDRRQSPVKQEEGGGVPVQSQKAGSDDEVRASNSIKDGEPEAKKRKRSQRACVRCRGQKLKCDGVFPCGRCLKLKLACKEPADPNTSLSSSSSMLIGSNSQCDVSQSSSRNGPSSSSRPPLPSPSPQRRQHHHLYHSASNLAAAQATAPGSASAAPSMTAGATGLASADMAGPITHHGRGGGPAGSHHHGGPSTVPLHDSRPVSWEELSAGEFMQRLERLESMMERISQRVERETSLSWQDLAPLDVLRRFDRLEATMDRIAHKLDRDGPSTWPDDRYAASNPASIAAGPMDQQSRYLAQLPPPPSSTYAPQSSSRAGGPPPPLSANNKAAALANGASNHAHDPRRPARLTTPDDSELEIDELAQDGQSEKGMGSVEHTPRNGCSGILHGAHHLGQAPADPRSAGEVGPLPAAGPRDSYDPIRADRRESYDPIRGGYGNGNRDRDYDRDREREREREREYERENAARTLPLDRRLANPSPGPARLPRLDSNSGLDRWHHSDQRGGHAHAHGHAPGPGPPPGYPHRFGRDGRSAHPAHPATWQPGYAD